jgi:hypothetical protein
MAGQRSARRGNRRAASGSITAGRRDIQKHINFGHTSQQPLGTVSVYDGLSFCGAVIPHQHGRWLAVDADGRRLGTFDLRHRAEHAVFQAHRPGGVA